MQTSQEYLMLYLSPLELFYWQEKWQNGFAMTIGTILLLHFSALNSPHCTARLALYFLRNKEILSVTIYAVALLAKENEIQKQSLVPFRSRLARDRHNNWLIRRDKAVQEELNLF